MLLTDTNSSEKVKKNVSYVQGVKWNIPKEFQIVSCTKPHLPLKFHENPFSRFSNILLTDRHTHKQTYNDENITFTVGN